MGGNSLQWIGWAATGMTIGSYFCRDQVVLRRVQAVAALVWITYGAVIGAPPIIAANILVAGVAVWSSLRWSRKETPDHGQFPD